MASSKLRQSSLPVIFEQIYKTIDARIEKRERAVFGEDTQEPTDFIDLFLDARAEQDFDNHAEFTKMGVHVTKQLTREEIAAQCFIFLLAGFDTTANSLAYITYLLAKNPDIQRNLQEEIDQYCNLETINYETLASMTYLDCSVKEGLRMYPTANVANSRRCMKSTTLGDVEIHEGEYVLADTFTLHYDPEIWGEDANEFRPERWMNADRPIAAWLSFGLGPRQCIGMRLAQMEEKLVLAHLLKRYDIVATNDTEDELILKGSMTVAPTSVTVQLRNRKLVS
ncbi:unspecific monooxygenase [Ancylostoma caninum]|uniref:Unspecific monooxygenase n=1 Tax=Ancylostoma caninum TaxID=29170 RepID=A0A368H198_ANCCA|nr:unspecific monooxygenase [Ancylostoma caninum]